MSLIRATPLACSTPAIQGPSWRAGLCQLSYRLVKSIDISALISTYPCKASLEDLIFVSHLLHEVKTSVKTERLGVFHVLKNIGMSCTHIPFPYKHPLGRAFSEPVRHRKLCFFLVQSHSEYFGLFLGLCGQGLVVG